MGFRFSKRTLHLELEGYVFELEAAGAAAWLQDSIKMLENAKRIIARSKDNGIAEEDIEQILSEFVESFDTLLGGGATSKIFGERPVNFYDCYDMYLYIVKEIRAFATAVRKEFDNAL